jgi:hypothetical protein
MEQFSLEQLRTLLIVVIGAILLLMTALIVYVVLAGRKKTTRSLDKAQQSGPASSASTRPLSLVRDTEGGPLQVEIGGVRYQTLAEVQDVDSKRQIVIAAMELVRFTGVLGRAVQEPVPIDKTYHWREDLRQESQEELKQIRGAVGDQPAVAGPATRIAIEEQFLSMLAEMGQTPSPLEKPGIVSSIQLALKPKGIEERSRTFVDQIEEILQRRMKAIPAFHGRELHMLTDPTGTVRFQFDGHEYQDANDIPNLTARQLIADAIKEWEEIT